jgi:hypothetical protein
MKDEPISIDKLKEIFAMSTGERTIEVTEGEYKSLYREAQKKGLVVNKKEDRFGLKLGNLSLTILTEIEEDDDEDE